MRSTFTLAIVFAFTLLVLPQFAHSQVIGKARTHYLLTDATSVAAGSAIQPIALYKSFHALGNVTAATGASTIDVEVSNDCVNYFNAGTLSLTLGTTVTSTALNISSPYKCVRGNVKTISGTGAKVSLIMGAQY